MSKGKAYRHPYNRALQPDRFTRPPLPWWLSRPLKDHLIDGKSVHSWRYWNQMYWATPPWLSDEQVEEMKRIVKSVPDDYHIDHEVPLRSKYVCGLNVPWNLQYLPKNKNIAKGNWHWQDMPMAPQLLFDEEELDDIESQFPRPPKRRDPRTDQENEKWRRRNKGSVQSTIGEIHSEECRSSQRVLFGDE